jgi:hypothetical protein
MRLIIEGFNSGLIDQNVISRMNLAQPTGGLTSNEIRISKCPATDVDAMEFWPRLTVSKMHGRTYTHTTPWQNSAIIRLYQYRDANDGEHAIVFSCVSGATSAAIAEVDKMSGTMTFNTISISGDALSAWAPTVSGDMIDICTYGSSAIITYGESMPLAVYTGSTFIAPLLGTNAPSGAKTVAAWGSYLFVGNVLVGGVRHKSRIQWCDPMDPTTWSAYSYIELDPDDGDEIRAMWLLKDTLVVFKKYKIFLVKYVGGALTFDWERIDDTVGCVGSNAITEVGKILYFISASGFYAFDGSRPPYEISKQIRIMANNTNADVEKTFEVDYYGDGDQIYFTVANGSSTKKNRVYIYDSEQENWTKWDVELAGIGSILYGAWERYIDFPLAYNSYDKRLGESKSASDAIFTFGSYDGYLYEFGSSSNDLNNAMECYWISPWIDFGYPDHNKRILRVYVYVEGTEDAYTINFDGFADWNDQTPQVSKTFTTQAEAKVVAEKRLDFTLPCRAFKFKISSEGLNTTLIVHKVIVEFLVKGRTITS